jgi:NitT/TauT family transport system permease protein
MAQVTPTARPVGSPPRSAPRIGMLIGPVIFALLLGVWEAVIRLLGVSEILVPAPSSIASALWAGLVVSPRSPVAFYGPTLRTLSEALGGLSIGATVGLALAVLLTRVRVIERYAMPYIMAFQSLPKIAIAPLFIVWFGFGVTSIVVLVATSTFFAILVNAVEGFKSTDVDRLDLMRAIGASPAQTFWTLILPGAFPFIFSGLQIALVISILSTIVGEFINGRDGLGARILLSNNVLDIPDVFAVLIILGTMAAGLDFLLRLIRRRVLFWSPGERRLGL